MRVSVFGLGYVGCVTVAGHTVIGVLDRSVSIARLGGANRRYIEEEIPHIASLMCNDLETVLEHAEILAIGHAGEDARRSPASRRPDQQIVDLTQGVGRLR